MEIFKNKFLFFDIFLILRIFFLNDCVYSMKILIVSIRMVVNIDSDTYFCLKGNSRAQSSN